MTTSISRCILLLAVCIVLASCERKVSEQSVFIDHNGVGLFAPEFITRNRLINEADLYPEIFVNGEMVPMVEPSATNNQWSAVLTVPEGEIPVGESRTFEIFWFEKPLDREFSILLASSVQDIPVLNTNQSLTLTSDIYFSTGDVYYLFTQNSYDYDGDHLTNLDELNILGSDPLDENDPGDRRFTNSPQRVMGDASTRNGEFGRSLKISGNGNTLVMSGLAGEFQNLDTVNSVYTYEKDGDVWVEKNSFEIVSENEFSSDGYGAIDISDDGSTLALSAISDNSESTGVESAAVFVYIRAGDGWGLQKKIAIESTGNIRFGSGRLSLSGDGNTLVVGEIAESTTALNSGAVFIFTRTGSDWSQQAKLKAETATENDHFGVSVDLDFNGDILAVSTESFLSSNGVYIFRRSGTSWNQVQYLTAGNPNSRTGFGSSLTFNGDGSVLAVTAPEEDNSARGINMNESISPAVDSGSVYIFTNTSGSWTQQAYIKASNTEESDDFGSSVALSQDGNTLAVGAIEEDNSFAGVAGIGEPDNQLDNVELDSGAVYIFKRTNVDWIQETYMKASQTGFLFNFGAKVSLSGDASALAVSAEGESGVLGSEGVVYLY